MPIPRLLLISAVFTATLAAQNVPAFEVATIRVAADIKGDITLALGQQKTTADTLTTRNTTMREIIQRAYGVVPQALEAPDWIRQAKFDLVGKATQPATDAELWAMVRPLLAERFKLKFHTETREVNGLAMVQVKNGTKLKVSEGGSNNLEMKNGVLNGYNVTLNRLAQLLSAFMGRPVKDETGLGATYDFRVDARAYLTEGQQQNNLPSLIVTAIQEELGLKLESRKFTFEVMVVDHLEQTPADN